MTRQKTFNYFIFYGFGAILGSTQAFSQFCAQKSLLVAFGKSHGMLEMEPMQAACRASTLSAAISLQLNKDHFSTKNNKIEVRIGSQ